MTLFVFVSRTAKVLEEWKRWWLDVEVLIGTDAQRVLLALDGHALRHGFWRVFRCSGFLHNEVDFVENSE